MTESEDTSSTRRYPWRILRNGAKVPGGRYTVDYASREARDKGAQHWANVIGEPVATEFWSLDNNQDELNRGWACDGAVYPQRQHATWTVVLDFYEGGGALVVIVQAPDADAAIAQAQGPEAEERAFELLGPSDEDGEDITPGWLGRMSYVVVMFSAHLGYAFVDPWNISESVNIIDLTGEPQ